MRTKQILITIVSIISLLALLCACDLLLLGRNGYSSVYKNDYVRLCRDYDIDIKNAKDLSFNGYRPEKLKGISNSYMMIWKRTYLSNERVWIHKDSTEPLLALDISEIKNKGGAVTSEDAFIDSVLKIRQSEGIVLKKAKKAGEITIYFDFDYKFALTVPVVEHQSKTYLKFTDVFTGEVRYYLADEILTSEQIDFIKA